MKVDLFLNCFRWRLTCLELLCSTVLECRKMMGILFLLNMVEDVVSILLSLFLSVSHMDVFSFPVSAKSLSVALSFSLSLSVCVCLMSVFVFFPYQCVSMCLPVSLSLSAPSSSSSSSVFCLFSAVTDSRCLHLRWNWTGPAPGKVLPVSFPPPPPLCPVLFITRSPKLASLSFFLCSSDRPHLRRLSLFSPQRA